MASRPTSRIRFVDGAGLELATPREWTPARVVLDVPVESLQDVRLVRNGEAMPVFAQSFEGGLRVLADWPRSGTGRYRLTLAVADASEEREVAVAPEKISPEAYGRLIEDLQTSLPASIAIGLQRCGALSGLELQPPSRVTLAQELDRLRRAVLGEGARPGLASLLHEIARDPHTVLRKTEVWVGRGRARRIEPVGLLAAFRRPTNIEAGTSLPIQVPDVRVEHTFDVYENRLVRTYHDQVGRRLRHAASAFEAEDLLIALAETEELLRILRRARHAAAFLDDVGTLGQVQTRVTMVLLKRPSYRGTLESYLRFRRSGVVQLDEPRLETPLEDLPDLYEAWGTLHVIDSLLRVAAELGYEVRVQRLARQEPGGIFVRVLPDAQPALVLVKEGPRRVVTLTPQRWFTPTGSPLRSISFQRAPDVTMEVASGDHSPVLYLFDPKYKLSSEAEAEPGDGKPKKIDIDAMHAYRDAIRDLAEERVVRYAATLYPGLEARYGDGIEALSARPLDPDVLDERLGEVMRLALA